MDRSSMQPETPTWVALADGGPIARTASLADGRLRVTNDRQLFLDLLSRTRPRVAIVAMPPADDTNVDSAMRERRRRTGLRLLHVSSPDAIDARVGALRRGFDDAVADSVDPIELLGRIRLLEERTRIRGDALLAVAEGVTIDSTAHEVRRDGTLIHMRPKEFQLLALLAANPGRAYTRRQILDRVWGHDHDGDPRTVDVHVRWLRSKIEALPERPLHLVTVRGIGYRLDPDPR